MQGIIKSGLGQGKYWINKFNPIFIKKNDIELFPGTLNIEVEKPYKIEEDFQSIHGSEYGGTEEVLIKERQQTAFFNKIVGLNKIKMPGANLHKLGGKAFLSKMQDMGWMLQYSSSGSMIADDGMIHWKKENG